MANIVIKHLGSNSKVKALKIIREEMGLELKEAKELVDEIQASDHYVLEGIPRDRVEEVINLFVDIGVEAFEEVIEMQETTSVVKQEFGSLSIDSRNVSNLDRETTLMILTKVKQVIQESERYDEEIRMLIPQITSANQEAESIRKQVSPETKRIMLLLTIAGAVVGLFVGNIPGLIVLPIVTRIILNCTLKKKDLERHQEDNENKANEYINTVVVPLQEKVANKRALRDELMQSDRYAWSVEVIGRDMLYSACVDDLYNLIKSRRADSLKEALNKYDDEQHKARMEEMQRAIKGASEVAAVESIKQTEKLSSIEKSSQQAATAAKQSARYSRKTYYKSKK